MKETLKKFHHVHNDLLLCRPRSNDLTLHHPLCQRRTKIPPLAGVKIHHFARLQVCPQTRLAQCLPQHRSYAGLWSSRIVWEWSGVQGLIALLQPITVTVHLQDMNMMCQPI